MNSILSIVFTLSFFASAATFDAVPLRNHLDGSFTLKSLSSNYLLLTFFFSSCPMQKMCPLSIRKTRLTLEAAKSSGITQFSAVGITLDPARDSEKVLAAYAKREALDPKTFWLATGKPSDLDQITSEFNVIGIGQQGSVSHNVRSVLLGPGLRFIKNFDENEWKPEDVVKVINLDTAKARKS